MSNPALRKRHEVVERALMPFRAEGIDIKDLAADEEAKEAWKRIRGSNMELPCILVDGQRAGSIEELENAIENGEVRQFLGLDKAPLPPGQTREDAALEADLSNLSQADMEALAKELEAK